MGIVRISPFIAALTAATTVAAHGHVSHIVIDGLFYQGYDPTSFPYQANPPTVVGWATSQTDNGFVEPNSFANADIICHKSSVNAGGHAQVAAGSSISISWDTWPESHKGPMIDYLAACDGDCESADKAALAFFKIDEVGLIDDSASNGFWGSDVLIQNNNTWLVQIPSNIKAGNYVLRHETIALHSAGSANGAQAYPQCINLEVTGGGADVPAGTLATELYTPQDPGILVNIYTTGLAYTIPGPALIAGASSSVAQSSSAITATGTATVPGGGAAAPGTTTAAGTTTTAAAATTTAAAATSTAVVSTPTTLATSTRAAATSPTTAATTTTTTAAAATTTAAAEVGAQSLYGQCGMDAGKNYAGPTACAEGTCKSWNPYYYQCVATA
ncbi:carbohydrate-binding module family 1 protein [Hypoxylon rubiginosum]|uniref:Carbohydrate-binding module family 1 protein n=1 Tax=Hypoxylon rubiginosum TaxID=110542 RepID=A0ACB9YT66_9PEZI|nr:carbohydrate-binding module family 1 protein [Hypoxylon rubiginosum]